MRQHAHGAYRADSGRWRPCSGVRLRKLYVGGPAPLSDQTEPGMGAGLLRLPIVFRAVRPEREPRILGVKKIGVREAAHLVSRVGLGIDGLHDRRGD